MDGFSSGFSAGSVVVRNAGSVLLGLGTLACYSSIEPCRGRIIVNVVPVSASLVTLMVPPFSSIRSRHNARPSPLQRLRPLTSADFVLSNGSKMCGR